MGNDPRFDTCPYCGRKATHWCKCPRNERFCKNGHAWRRADDGEAIPLPIPYDHRLGDSVMEGVALYDDDGRFVGYGLPR